VDCDGESQPPKVVGMLGVVTHFSTVWRNHQHDKNLRTARTPTSLLPLIRARPRNEAPLISSGLLRYLLDKSDEQMSLDGALRAVTPENTSVL